MSSPLPARLPDAPVPGRPGLRGHGDVVVIPKRGLQFPRQLPFERWVRVGRQLSDIHTSSAWCLGDWLVFGEAAYSGRYRDAVELTCLDYQTLRNYAWVARRFALSRRRDSLSFGHHAEVAALGEAEQGFWLRKAEELRWSVKRLRRELQASLAERDSGGDSPPGGAAGRGDDDGQRPGPARDPLVRVHVHITAQQLQTCRAAAARAGMTIEAWAALVLDHAALHGLPASQARARDLVPGSHAPLDPGPAQVGYSCEQVRKITRVGRCWGQAGEVWPGLRRRLGAACRRGCGWPVARRRGHWPGQRRPRRCRRPG